MRPPDLAAVLRILGPVFALLLSPVLAIAGNDGSLLLYTTKDEVRITNVSKPGKVSTIAKGLEKGLALDFYYEGQMICWTDFELEKIKCMSHNGSQVNDKSGFVIPGCVSYGLTIDWYTEKLYWTDRETDRIEVASLTHNYRKVLFWSELDEPRAIGVAPMDGLLFWTDWGEVAKIERASMNGDPKSRVVIIDSNIFWPNALTIDYQAKKIYWLDAKLFFIDVMNYDGSGRNTIMKDILGYAVSMTMFNDKLYWADWKTWFLYSWNITTKGPVKEIIRSENEPTDVKVWDPQRQPLPNSSHPCLVNNGNCSHLCLLSSTPPGYSCACPTGVKLINNFQCADGPQSQLMLVQKAGISRISLDSPDYTSFILPLKDIKSAVTVDFNSVNKYIYWTDSEALTISRSMLNGSNQSVVIQGNLGSPDGIAVDSVAGNIYWTDPLMDTITVARLDGSTRKVLINANLSDPRAIAVAPSLGWMFWSDWSNHVIERASLDGSDRIILITKDLKWPNGIALDVEERKIYWGDGKNHNIEVSNMDGSDRRELLGDNLPHIFGMTILGDYIYWTDWQRRSLSRVHKVTGEREGISDQFHGVMGLKAFKLNEKLPLNPCFYNNGNCSHFCFNRPIGYTCGCPIGLEFGKDNRTCVKPVAFLLYARKDKIGRLSIENSNDNAFTLANVKQASALAIHVAEGHIYWADSKLHNIGRCAVNGSNFEQVIDWTNLVNGLAVDWCGNNLYWTDSNAQRIEASKLDGSSRRTLIWQSLRKPSSIVLDPIKGYMYWSDWGKSIKRAEMDGSNPLILIDQVGRANALNIDQKKGKLIWVTIDPAMIESADLDGTNRKKLIVDSVKMPFALTLYQDYMYWADWDTGDVSSAVNYSGSNRTVLYKNMEDICALEIYHESRQVKTNPCRVNNGGCSHLCLSIPATIQNKQMMYRCACPTHYTLNKDNRTCSAPTEFILFSHRNGIGRMITGGPDCPDASLPVLGLKSMRAISYDPLYKNIYWVDGRTHSIRYLPENGGRELSVVAKGVDLSVDMAIDTIGRVIYFSCPESNTINVTRLDNITSSVGVVVYGEGVKPRHIVIHQTKRLLFWADVGNGLVMRSLMDGSKTTEIAQARNISALTLDPYKDTVYWANSKQIYAATISGNNRRMIWQGGNVTSLAVLKSMLYWIDSEKQLMHLPLNKKDAPARPALRVQHVYDVTAVYKIDTKHPCMDGTCPGVCLADGKCGCVRGLLSQGNGGRCSLPPPCGEDHFACVPKQPSHTLHCISKSWRCDGQSDCDNDLDEVNCKICLEGKFRCSDDRCIESSQVCDGINHCTGGDDEAQCCSDLKNFRCPTSGICIAAHYLCDKIEHCSDGADESPDKCSQTQVDSFNSNVRNSYVFGLVGLAVLIVTLSGFFYCRKHMLSKSNNFLPDDKALDPLSPKPAPHPHVSVMNCPSTSNNSKAAKMGRKLMEGMRMSGLNGSSSSYDRNHITGASSSATNGSSFIGRYPRELLNPPPSPATTAPSCSVPLRHRPYRHYRVINQPPPPTPCSTDVCDESDCTMSYMMLGGFGMNLEAPPPTPCPPSPSSRSSTYFSPLPPPPSPVPPHYDS